MDKTIRRASAGEVIFEKGDLEFFFYEVVSGTISTYIDYGKDTQTFLSDIGPGGTVGEIGLLSFRPRSATCIAKTDVELMKISENELEDYFAEDPERVLKIMRQLSDRTRDLTSDLNEALSTVNDIKNKEKSDGLKLLIDRFAGIWRRAK